jgi:hypothetical protein
MGLNIRFLIEKFVSEIVLDVVSSKNKKKKRGNLCTVILNCRLLL